MTKDQKELLTSVNLDHTKLMEDEISSILDNIITIDENTAIVIWAYQPPELVYKGQWELTKDFGDKWSFVYDPKDSPTDFKRWWSEKDIPTKHWLIFARLINIWNGMCLHLAHDN